MKHFCLAFTSLLFLLTLLLSCSDDVPEPEPAPTPEVINTPPSSFKVEVSGITKDSAVIKWTKAVDTEKDNVLYTVFLGASRVASNLDTTVFIASRLSPETEYRGYVLARDGKDSTRTEFSFTTKDAFLKFNKTYTFPGLQSPRATSLCMVEDGYVIAGAVYAEKWEVHVVKINLQGNVAWNRRYAVNAADQSPAIAPAKDGGFVITSGLYILRIDSNGNQIWIKEAPDRTVFKSVIATKENSFIAVGTITQPIGTRAILMKLSLDGSIIWQKIYGEHVLDLGSDVIQTTSGGLMLLGARGRTVYSHESIWVVSTDQEGNIVWEDEYPDEGYAFAEVIKETKDGGYVIGGSSWGGYDFSRMRVLRIDKEGKVLWNKYFAQNSSFQTNDLEVTSDGGYVLTGYLKSNSTYSPMVLGLFKLNSSGTQEWGREYLRDLWNNGNDVLQTSDGGYMIAGTVNSFEYSKVWILKLNPLGLDQ